MNASKEQKRACPFSSLTPRRKKMTNHFATNEWASKLAESDKGYYYNQEKRLEDDKAPEKPIETTAESSFTSSLVSRVQFLGREAAKREVPQHIKIGQSTVLKVYCSGKEDQEKLQEAVCSRFFQGSVKLLKIVLSKSGLGSTWLVRCENENCPLQITNEAFSTTERIEQSRAFEINCSSVVRFHFQLFLLCHYCCPFSDMHQH